jgi:protein TonB
MKTSARTTALSIIVSASLCGCGTVVSVASTAVSTTYSAVSGLFHSKMKDDPANSVSTSAPVATAAPAAAPGPGLDAYKTEVAQHLIKHNPDHIFSGDLPDMLPAIVVLNITVDKNGDLTAVEVQRSRDPDASKVALASVRSSAPLPKPASLLAKNKDSVTFSETFLFNSQYRFQLRSLAGPQ